MCQVGSRGVSKMEAIVLCEKSHSEICANEKCPLFSKCFPKQERK